MMKLNPSDKYPCGCSAAIEYPWYFISLKRSIDICISLLLLIMSIPMLILVALGIRLESQGPIIYTQERVGLGGRVFTLYKFRSMYQDSGEQAAMWTAVNDKRITKIGKYIRKLHIDELPQLWNILKNDMSFIGPRPEQVDIVRKLAMNIQDYHFRHHVKPGLTGLAQVCYPYAASEEDARHKLSYDLYYINNMSFSLEIKILIKTVGAVLKGV